MKVRLLVFLALAMPSAMAKFAGPQLAPVDTLVKNAGAYTKAHPEEANGWYVLGRVHYLAFANQATSLEISRSGGRELDPEEEVVRLYTGPGTTAYYRTVQAEAERRALKAGGFDEKSRDPESRAKVSAETSRLYKELLEAKWTPPALPPEQAAAHAKAAFEAFGKATAIDPGNALFQLGLASLREQYGERRAELEKGGAKDLPAATTKDALAEAYLKAFSLAKEKDAAAPEKPLLGLSAMVSHEAGQAYLKLAPDGAKAEAVKAHLKKLDSLPRGPITPILFPADRTPVRSISSLLDPGAQVSFDLAGFGGPSTWPWIKPGTSLLVWDPEQSGLVRDGRQLFGTYTWGIFWKDGFHALSMLDDNHDGILSGHELTGMAAWTDRNSNGLSDPGEVVALRTMAVDSIITTATGSEGIHPHHPAGIVLRDGSTRPVWDWIVAGSR